MTDFDFVGAQVIIRRILDVNLLPPSDSCMFSGILTAVLEGTGDPSKTVQITGMSCEADLGSKSCIIGILSTSELPGNDATETTFNLVFRVYQGHLVSAKIAIPAG